MKCFNHPLVEAVGICKNCSKGICHACLTEVKNGIACTSTCVEEVKLINTLIERNSKSYKNAAGAYYKNAIIYGGLGGVFLLVAFYNNKISYFFISIRNIVYDRCNIHGYFG